MKFYVVTMNFLNPENQLPQMIHRPWKSFMTTVWDRVGEDKPAVPRLQDLEPLAKGCWRLGYAGSGEAVSLSSHPLNTSSSTNSGVSSLVTDKFSLMKHVWFQVSYC